MASTTTFNEKRLANVEAAINEVEVGGTATILNKSYGESDLELLEAWQRRLSVQVAIERIEAGAQEYTVLGRSFKRGELPTLYKRLDQERKLEKRLRRRGGLRVRGIVPTG